MNKIIQIAASLAVLVLVILMGLAPIGPMPGVFIGGTQAAAPVDWGNTAVEHEIRLKVPGTLPRVVIIWVIQYENDLYVVGGKDSGWVKMLDKGGKVDMRLGDNTYGLTASLVESGWEPVMSAYVEKYRPDYPDIINGFPSIKDAKGSISVFKLSRG